MPSQQVCALPARTSMFLVFTVHDDSASLSAVRKLLADFPGLTRSVSFRAPSDELIGIVGVGSRLWDQVFPDSRPTSLHPFEEIRGDQYTAVSTPGDLLFHLRADHIDLCFELAAHLSSRLDGHAEVVDEVHGFKYFDERDLLGFVDGTENPEGDDARKAVTVGAEDPDFVGGSYVIVQKYLHDMTAWNSLSTEGQERVIGRTKVDNIEMSDDVKPSNSHIALNDISDDDGNDLSILRENMPFGSIEDRDFGTYFIGYAKDPGITEQMLRNMFLGSPIGNYDRILDFSTATTGSLYFVPSVEFLSSL
ncbi:Dyp-type peroxidase [Corynebacterium glyciniphilum]|uniref:Dyp-type peroxidase n=1 Tax=Corynebacterium glyciniphilum TaxID=1404244 RepID=UPI003DA16453